MSSGLNQTAACCAQFYEQDWVQAILGESFHPGGVGLTKRLLESLSIEQGEQVIDVACGIGTTSLLVDELYGANVWGIDYSESNVQRAADTAAEREFSIQFTKGDATSLPVGDAEANHLICECAVSTFSDQPKAVAEFYRALKPGGQVAISDMVLNGQLPTELESLLAPWTCLSSAKTAAGYQQLFIDAGFVVTSYVDESQSLLDMILDLKKKLLIAGLGKTLATADGVPDMLASLNIADLKTLLGQAQDLVKQGVVQYCRMTFAKGTPKPTKTFGQQAEPNPMALQINDDSCGPGCDC